MKSKLWSLFVNLGLLTLPAAAQTTLISGTAASFTIPAVTGVRLLSGTTGFRIVVPDGATRLEVRLGSTGSAQVAIGVRYGTDFSTTTFNNEWGGVVGENPVVILPSSVPPLRGGTFFIGMLVVSNSSPVSSSITATVSSGPASSPTISVPGALDFGTVTVGQTRDMNLRVQNTGSAGLSVSALTFSDAQYRAVSATAPFNIAAGAQQEIAIRFQPSAAGSRPGTLTIVSNDPSRASVVVSLTGQGAAAAPVPAISAVVNGASFQSGIASGSWITIRGANLSATTRIWRDADFAGVRLPVTLDGVSVKVNDRDALIYFVSPTQVNALAPADNSTGTVSVTLSNSLGTSTPAQGTYLRVAPALFAFDPENGRYPAAVHANGTFVGRAGLFGAAATTVPARSGGRILLFGTGFGLTAPAADPAVVVPGPSPLATPNDLRILVGGVAAVVEFAGLISNGLYQFNIVVPVVPDGDQTLVAEIGGQRSQSQLRLTVGDPPPAPAGLEYFPMATGMSWDYRVEVPATASLPFKPSVEEPNGLLCASVFCGTQSWTAGQYNFRLTVGARIGTTGLGEGWRLTATSPGGRFLFGTESWPLELRAGVRDGVPQWDVVAAPAGFRLARLLARITPSDLANLQTLTVGGRAYTNVVRTTVVLSRDGVYLGQDYTAEIFLAPGTGILRVVMRNAAGATLFTQELTQFTAP